MSSDQGTDRDNQQLIESLQQSDFSRRKFLLQTAAGAATAVLPGIVILPSSALAADAPTKSTTSVDASKLDASKAASAKPAEFSVRAINGQAAPDGRSRAVFTYDGKIPGPVIRAKLGQTLKIKVTNDLKFPTSIHWHGMHQPGTWQMDGVDLVSHDPIPPGKDFTYEFTATPAGTHWYHSHTGVQYSDGLFGPLIVDEPTPIAKYDREEILLINEWFVEQSDAILAGLIKPATKKSPAMDSMGKQSDGKSSMAAGAMKSDGMQSVMAAGKSAKSDSAKSDSASNSAMAGMSGMKGDGKSAMNMGAKPDIGDVPFESGLINGQGRFGNNTSAELATIKVKRGETLRLRLISGASTFQFRFQIDGHPLTVIATDGASMKPVEVDSLMLSPGERYDVLLKATSNKSAWIRAVTLDGKETKAVLLYTDGTPGELPTAPVAWGKRELMPEQMKSPAAVKLDDKPQEIKLTLGGTMSPYAWSINGQKFPDADPIKLAADKNIRFIMENPTMMDHPFHIHGHYFYVLGKPDKLNLVDPVQKDSVNIPAGSTLVLQWFSDNPGRWFFHCHIEWHLATGMARVIEIA